jgi:hypothetical protein
MIPSELLPHELIQIVADFFESQGVPYRVVGSLASMVYGEPRFTNDVDIVAELRLENSPAGRPRVTFRRKSPGTGPRLDAKQHMM